MSTFQVSGVASGMDTEGIINLWVNMNTFVAKLES